MNGTYKRSQVKSFGLSQSVSRSISSSSSSRYCTLPPPPPSPPPPPPPPPRVSSLAAPRRPESLRVPPIGPIDVFAFKKQSCRRVYDVETSSTATRKSPGTHTRRVCRSSVWEARRQLRFSPAKTTIGGPIGGTRKDSGRRGAATRVDARNHC